MRRGAEGRDAEEQLSGNERMASPDSPSIPQFALGGYIRAGTQSSIRSSGSRPKL